MTNETIDLYKFYNLEGYKQTESKGILTTYIHEIYKERPFRIRPALLVLGGGGYQGVSQRETEIVAMQYFAKGYNVFTLLYSTKPIKYPYPLLEADLAMIYIREHSKELFVDSNHIAVLGFSAGGHLAGMLSLIPDEKEITDIIGDKACYARPDATVFCYPVITSGKEAHRGSFFNLCGDDKELTQRLSLENRVTDKTPPAFLWTTYNDNAVPSENSLYMALAYKKQNVPCELHMFADGIHGLSLGTKETFRINKPIQIWVELSLTWLENLGFDVIDPQE